MDLKKSLKSKKAANVIQRVCDSAVRLSEENRPFKITKIGIGGSVLRKRAARDIDIVLEVVKNRNTESENMTRFFKEYLNAEVNNLDLHIVCLDSGLSDRKIPYIELWNWKKGFRELNENDFEVFLVKEFEELSSIVRKIENYSMDIPDSLKPSVNILKRRSADILESHIKSQISDSLKNSLKNLQYILSDEEIILADKNTFLRDELKRFALTGLLGRELSAECNYLEIEQKSKLFDKFKRCGVSKDDFITVVKRLNFN
jgi:predicted nucleotidyltransferase